VREYLRVTRRLFPVIFLFLVSLPAHASVTSACHIRNLSSAVECGELTVPLDYAQPQGSQVSIGFVVLPAFNPSSHRNPLIFLAGGPGQAATSIAAQVNQMFSSIRANRDIILIDQRGTGRSAALECAHDMPIDLASDYDLFDPGLLADCVAQLPEGIEHFTTANAIRDFERVRASLGITQVDLYGGSYGSRAAFAYLALAGGSVGAVILDGVSPPSVPIGLFGKSGAAAFERAITRCANITSCHTAFPNLRDDFERLDAQLREGPLGTKVPDPVTGEMTDFKLRHGQFISLLRLTLYSPASTVLMPALVSEAARGNLRPLAALLVSASDSLGEVNTLLNLTIVCNEDVPRYAESALLTDAQNAFGGDASQAMFTTACPLMPRFESDLSWMAARDFPHPALLLSGEGDPVTPPANGDIAAQLFQQAQHVIVPEAAHIVASSECGGDLIEAFLEDPIAGAVDTACIDDIPAQRFRLDPMGSLSIADKERNPS